MPIGGSDGSYYETKLDFLAATAGIAPPTASGMPPEASTEPAGALKSSEGTQTPEKPQKEGFFNRLSIVNALKGMTNPDFSGDVEFAKSLWRSVSLPGEALRGEIDPMTDEGIRRTTEMALNVVGAPAPVVSRFADGTLGAMAGVRSKGFNLNKKAEAQVLEHNGKDVDAIYQATGMFRGTDGKWRYEIPDGPAEFNPDWHIDLSPPKPEWSRVAKEDVIRPLTEVIDHPELYNAYPQLKDVKVRVDPMQGDGAAWHADEQTIRMGPKVLEDKGVLMHEVQHAIQDIEGFAKGGAVAEVSEKGGGVYSLKYQLTEDSAQAIRDAINNFIGKHKAGEKLTEDELDKLGWFGRILDTHSKYLAAANRQAAENYLRLAGETEARNVQTRVDLSPSEARATPPWATEDVPRQYQIGADLPEAAWTTAYGYIHPKTGEFIKPQASPIRAAALKIGDHVFEGVNHVDAMDKAKAAGVKGVPYDGFVTQEGKFVSREEAAALVGKKDERSFFAKRKGIRYGLASEDIPELRQAGQDFWSKKLQPKYDHESHVNWRNGGTRSD